MNLLSDQSSYKEISSRNVLSHLQTITFKTLNNLNDNEYLK